jgi:hypothetical protein
MANQTYIGENPQHRRLQGLVVTTAHPATPDAGKQAVKQPAQQGVELQLLQQRD